MNAIDPGKGYRLLSREEIEAHGLRDDDEFFGKMSNQWIRTGGTCEPSFSYRRRIEPTELTLKPGKWYRTRNGEKAWVYGPSPDGSLFGFIQRSPLLYWTWDASGGSAALDEFDIVGPWENEPTDEEIAEAVRMQLNNGKIMLISQDEQCVHPASPREFVDAVNQYRSENDQ